MVLDLKQSQKNLYDTDYNLWLEETVKQLQAKDFNAIDWENLIEEIASLGRSEKRRKDVNIPSVKKIPSVKIDLN